VIRIFEDVFSSFAMPYISIVTRAIIFSAYLLIEYSSEMNLMMTFLTLFTVVVIPFAGFSILLFSASVEQTSEKTLISWSHIDWTKYISKRDGKLWKRFCRSCRPFGVRVGDYYTN